MVHLPNTGAGVVPLLLLFMHEGRTPAGGTGVKMATRLLSCVQVRLKVPAGCVRLPRLSCMPLEVQRSTARVPTGSV